MKHRKAFFFPLLILVLLLLCGTAYAEESAAVFKTTPFEAIQSGAFSTTLYLEAGSNLVDFEFQLAYDPDLVELDSAIQSADLIGEAIVTPKDGAIHVSYTRSGNNLTKKTDFVEITFLINENVGPGRYSVLWLDTEYQSEAHTKRNNDLFQIPIETDFSPMDIYDFGDIDMNHTVSIADVTYLRQHLARIRTLTDYQLDRADAYYDHEISIADAVRIQQYLADHSMLLGNRVNITFIDKDGQINCVKSVVFGKNLVSIPKLPEYRGYYGGIWAYSEGGADGADFKNLESALTVYAVYKQDASPAVTFYKERLTNIYYSENTLAQDFSGFSLNTKMTYQGGYTADIDWSSTNNAILNSTTGHFTQPAYNSTVRLTATIISRLNGEIEAQDSISFEYEVIGRLVRPMKDSIRQYLATLFESPIDQNLRLPGKVTNADIQSEDEFEVRLDWLFRSASGQEQSIVQLSRSNNTQKVTLIAVATFHGTPLEDDGRIYFDDLTLNSVSINEVRSYLISQIAANTGLNVTNGEEFWHDDAKYGCKIRWISQNHDVATIENNVISIKDVINGTALPVNVEATFTSGEGDSATSSTIRLAYTVNVVTDNALLVPGTNIDEELWKALKSATGISGSLTTDALKNVKFVYLDLSAYPDIQDLTAITYCKNLRVLNISGLHVNETSLNQICTLTKLEALIANHCGIETMTVGGVPVLDKMINLKMLDLAHNHLQSLNSVLSKSNRYGKMEELYLNDNELTDISALCEVTTRTRKTYNGDGTVASETEENAVVNRAPMLRFLTLDNNHLNDEDLAAFSNFKVLKFLSLGNNEITSITNLKNTRTLLELHLQGNQIEDVRDLRFLTHLQSLYLSHNKIRNIYSGSKEGNISYLRYLTDLEILYLNGNDIEDVADLGTLYKLKVLNVNDNRIQSLSMLSDKGDTMVELYAENNQIDSFSFIRGLSGLKRLMLSHNRSIYESSLGGYLAGLTELRTLTLSDKELRSLSFLENMPELVRLDVANCKIPSYCPTSYSVNDDTLTVGSYTDNVAAILSRKDKLQFLDISNNGMAYGPAGITKYLRDIGVSAYADKVEFTGNGPTRFDQLYELTNLKVLYADNLSDSVNASSLFSVMTGISYLSMENCGITDTAWLSQFRRLVYVDLAGNNLQTFDLGNFISTRSHGTLEYLYIDSRTDTAFIDSFRTFDENILKEFSAENVKVNVLDYLPDMAELEYLNLSHSGITSLSGDNEDFEGWFTLSRYQTLRTLDLTGVQADIEEVGNLPALKTLYTVGGPEDRIFQKQNLLKLYELDNGGQGVEGHLYGYDERYVPSTEREGTLILGTLDDFSRMITVAADGIISDNNPVLPETVNGFDITWTVSNEKNYEIRNRQIAVKDYMDIEDETLILTASISVYPDQGTAERSFHIRTHILRADLPYLDSESKSVSEYLRRSDAFIYDVRCVAAETEGFSKAPAPVYTDVRYTYSAVLADGTEVPYTTIVTIGENHSYQIHNDAKLRSVLTIYAEVGHTVQGEFIADWGIEKNIQVVERSFTLTLIANGGSIISTVDGSTIESLQTVEDSPLFENLQVSWTGHTFTGWYKDVALTELFTGTVMPMSDLTLYAGWKINTYTVRFETYGGSAVNSQQVNYGSTATNPGSPNKTNHRFMGWYADSGFSTVYDFNTHITADRTIYARWVLDEYRVTFHPNGGSGGGTQTVVYNSTVSAPGVSRTGYTLVGWFRNSNGTNQWNLSSDRVTADVTLYAAWRANEYTVDFDGNGGSVNPGSKRVTYASNYGSLASASRAGYNFDGWYLGNTRIYDGTNVSTASNHTLTAHWNIIRVNIPNFSGWHINDVRNWCNSNGIRYSESWAYDYGVGENYIRSNSHSGNTVDWGTTITLYVSRGAKPISSGDRVYVDANTRYWATSYGTGTTGVFTRGIEGTVMYNIYPERKCPYNINGTGWVPASAVHQRTN